MQLKISTLAGWHTLGSASVPSDVQTRHRVHHASLSFSANLPAGFLSEFPSLDFCQISPTSTPNFRPELPAKLASRKLPLGAPSGR